MFSVQKQKPLHDQVYNLLKKELLTGEFKPGERIVEKRLAEKYGVSRGPIREALRLLEQDNLLEQRNNHLCVFQFTKKDVIEIYQCRKVLDSLAAELACEFITPEEIEDLKKTIELTKIAKAEKDPKKVIHYNTIFHEGIISASKNNVLISLLQSLVNRILFMRSMRNTLMTKYKGYEYFIKEHEGILEAIVNRQPDLARERISKHIDSDIHAFEDYMSKQASSEGGLN